MQVFVPFAEPIKVAQCLDPKRLNKQIIECKQILDAIYGIGKGWFNHPIVKMYKDYDEWLGRYKNCLELYKDGDDVWAFVNSEEAMSITPPFLTKEFCDQHKRRLYTKNPEYYKQFAEYGMSEENWYCIGNEIVKYINGKRIE